MTDQPYDTTDAGSDHLACGRSVDDVLDQVAAGRADERDDHQRGCPHCQAALAEYDRAWSPLRELAVEPVTAPAGLLEDALRRIRGAITHPDYGTIPSSTGRGVTRISARVVVAAARHSAQSVPGVRVALSRHVDPGQDGADTSVTAGVAGASTAVQITLAADYGVDLQALGERVREAVATRIRTLTDLQPVEITVIVDDVLP